MMSIGDVTFDTRVSFVDRWPYGHQILGLRGFFEHFRVLFQASDAFFEIDPRT